MLTILLLLLTTHRNSLKQSMPSTMASLSIPPRSSLSTEAVLTCLVVLIISILLGINLLMLSRRRKHPRHLIWRIDEGVNPGAFPWGFYINWNRVPLKTWLLLKLLASCERSPRWSHWREQENHWPDWSHHFTRAVPSLEGKLSDIAPNELVKWWICRSISLNSSQRRWIWWLLM